ncbi:MAG: ABC transporter ATP-binding protein [Propionibacteriaceae bacterium]|nr:ABC transporter ATP-binding protein [Propionibacteriaceae bacterium]
MTTQPRDETAGRKPILEARDVCMYFEGRSRAGLRTTIKAIDHVDFTLYAGQIMALVGESGSGKTTMARIFARMYIQTSGEVVFDGKPAPNKGRRLREYYSKVQLIFQDPFASLNTVKTLQHILSRPLRIHHKSTSRADTAQKVGELLAKVNLTPPERYIKSYPTALSGGQKQRVALARALAVEPSVLLADEPTSMLDASIRLEVLNLFRSLRDTDGVALLYITHDIASARYLSDDITVMYGGRIAEVGPTEDIIGAAKHPYTQLLIASAPDPARYKGSDAANISVDDAEPVDVSIEAPGCRFAPRCPFAMPICSVQQPTLLAPEPSLPNHKVACWLFEPHEDADAVGHLTTSRQSVSISPRGKESA